MARRTPSDLGMAATGAVFDLTAGDEGAYGQIEGAKFQVGAAA
ncbi:MAG TPA: hypothetical protein PLC74_12625 [Acetobacteraceae bacterium]|nr:hypothetical protein [Acetobacteraceae bacterium]